jgi:divalent metal cation (Fe/Co/Zn/Cd) transporter
VAGLAVLLCGGVGVASIVGLVVTGTAALNEQAHSAVANYLQAVGAGRYPQAYRLLCGELRDRQSLGEFTQEVSAGPKVREYELLRTRMRQNGDAVVPANVTYTNGTSTTVNYLVIQDNGEIRFCGTTG